MAYNTNIEIDKGSNQIYEYTWIDNSTLLPMDLTGFTAKMQVRNAGYSEVLLEEYSTALGNIWLGGDTGIIRIMFSPTDWIDYNSLNYKYDLFLTRTSDGNVTRLLSGFLSPSAQVTV